MAAILDLSSERFQLFLSRSHPDASYQLFGVNWPFGSGEEAKNRFSRWQGSWISNQNDFSYFDLLVTLMLHVKFQDKWPFVSGKEAKNRFSRCLSWQPSWTSHWNNFCYFLSTSRLNASYQVSSQLPLLFRWRPSWISDQNDFSYF